MTDLQAAYRQSPAHLSDRSAPRSSAAVGKTSANGVRRRISKACDRCNQLRTKCDGRTPCKHCVDNRLSCEYVRVRKKRGKVSKKDLARMAAVAAENDSSATPQSAHAAPPSLIPASTPQSQAGVPLPTPPTHAYSDQASNQSATSPAADPTSHHHHHHRQAPVLSSSYRPIDFAFPGSNLHDVQLIHGAEQSLYFGSDFSMPGFSAAPHLNGCYDPMLGMDSPGTLNAYHPSTNLGRLSDPTPPSPMIHSQPQAPTPTGLPAQPPAPLDPKYPVLKPVVPFIKSIIPLSLADTLLEHYFSGSSSLHPHPSSPYVIFFVVSRRSFLRQDHPRTCTPALLSSMLWLAARTCEAKHLTSSPSARGKTCQKLLELTIKLLRPLVHRPSKNDGVLRQDGQDASSVTDVEEPIDTDGVERSANGDLDDVITYIHLGTVVSASEYKAASLRWWNAAWCLAREMKLGRELPIDSTATVRGGDPRSEDDPVDRASEEECEERRRVWWLLFCVDRHLSLCYNKPLCLPDRECESLLQPMDEHAWHNTDLGGSSTTNSTIAARPPQRGASIEFCGTSTFGFFIPLMAILGDIIELNHSRSHPRFGAAFVDAGLWKEQARLINLRLDRFAQAIAASSAEMAASTPDPNTSIETHIQQRRAIAYSTHILHVLRILLTTKWDPIALLDDVDLWTYTPAFLEATAHAVAAAEAATAILHCDPEISHMPFFFGIYLLQGSFLLLLMANKLGRRAAPNVITACEDIIRCHESCAMTLSTEYQRNFRRVMRSALAQIRGHAPVDSGEEEQRRREVLSLYRWTGDGTGLAL